MKLPKNLSKGLNEVSKKLGKTGLVLKKYSPEICLAGSVLVGIGATVSACKATLEASDILDNSKEEIEALKEYRNDIDVDEKEYKKKLTSIYVATTVDLAKAYAPSIILGGLSITGIYSSNKIHRERSASMAAAYAALDTSYKNYRKNIIEKYGDDADKEAKYSLKPVKIDTVDENGKKKKETVMATSIDGFSEYARFFDESCSEWTKSPEYNLTYLRCRQSQANDMLRSKGYLFLNEVYSLLGIMPSKAGQTVGWIFDENNPNGDNYIDFGIYDFRKDPKLFEKARDFVNGYENVVLLDFNVDGPILEYFN